MKKDHEKRVEALDREVTSAAQKAQLIEANLQGVDAAIAAVNQVLASGMDWKEVANLIKQEAKAGNPVAGNYSLPSRIITRTYTCMILKLTQFCLSQVWYILYNWSAIVSRCSCPHERKIVTLKMKRKKIAMKKVWNNSKAIERARANLPNSKFTKWKLILRSLLIRMLNSISLPRRGMLISNKKLLTPTALHFNKRNEKHRLRLRK